MRLFDCPSLNGVVELTDEREQHIADRHAELLPARLDVLERTIAEPHDLIWSPVYEEHLFVRWTDTIKGGRFVVAVVVSDPGPRHWIITAYVMKRSPASDR